MPVIPNSIAEWMRLVRLQAACRHAGEVRVVVADSGIDLGHALLEDTNAMCLPSPAFASPEDESGHGTSVASIIAGHIGPRAFGFAPGVSLASVRIADLDGRFSGRDLVAALAGAALDERTVVCVAATDFGARSEDFDAMDQLVATSGALVVAAVGNEAISTRPFPAGAANVVGVAGYNGGALLPDTNAGPWIDWAAPGESLPAARRGGGGLRFRGSSAATAVLCGAVALVAGCTGGRPRDALDRLGRNAPLRGGVPWLDISTVHEAAGGE